jgi:1-acyl-sn-glycerol-3-phosphate acyltransferase
VAVVTPPPAPAPGHGAGFHVDPRRTVGYRICRALFRGIMGALFRPQVTGVANVPAEGPVIIAPVHRSFADFGFSAFVTRRKLFFMAKDDLWRNRLLGRLLCTLGAFPVHRQSADREALRNAEEVLRSGQVLVLFPEGTRQEGPEVQHLLEGAAFLAARTGAQIVPVGIGGSDRAMPKGSLIPKPFRVSVVVGPPIPPPGRSQGGRVSRARVHATTGELQRRIQEAYDLARSQVRMITPA